MLGPRLSLGDSALLRPIDDVTPLEEVCEARGRRACSVEVVRARSLEGGLRSEPNRPLDTPVSVGVVMEVLRWILYSALIRLLRLAVSFRSLVVSGGVIKPPNTAGSDFFVEVLLRSLLCSPAARFEYSDADDSAALTGRGGEVSS